MELPDRKTLLTRFEKFFEEYMKRQIREAIHKGQGHLEIDFYDILEHDTDLGDLILAHPEYSIEIMQETLKHFFLDGINKKEMRIRFISLPDSEKLLIREIRSEHLKRLLMIEGIVRRKTDVRPRLTEIHYLCSDRDCVFSEQHLVIPQLEEKVKVQKTCPRCRSEMNEVEKILIDAQHLVLEESSDQLDNQGDQPKRINILLMGDLVTPFKDSKTNPGSRVYVIGFVKEIQNKTRTGAESINYDLIIDANHIGMSEDDYSDIVVTKEEEKKIKELASKNDVMDILIDNISPSIYGHEKIKEAILLQLFGGAGAIKGDGTKVRGDIHILLVGDPGAAKSQLLKAATKIAPKSAFVSGKSASGVGLCVSPKSILLTNPGGMETIENVVEDRMNVKEEFRPGIWKQDEIRDVKIQSMSDNLKLHSKNPDSIWRLDAPKFVYEITLSSGKKVELTGNTQLFSLENGKTSWKKSMDLRIGDYIATPRKLIEGDKIPFIVDLIESNPTVHNIGDFIKKIKSKLIKKYGSIRVAAKKLGIDEGNLYYNWINDDKRGNVSLNTLKNLSNNVKLDYKSKVKEVSLYNGKNHILPNKLNKDIVYLAGLIAGDGDLSSQDTKSISIRLSNEEEELHKQFSKIITENFNLTHSITKGNNKRPKATRTHSKLLGEILVKLGVPLSPKSNKIYLSENLLHLPNKLLCEYIAGLYDADGSIYDNGSSGVIELTSCSETLIRQLQYVLLRFNIRGTIRVRKPTIGRIIGKYDRWNLEVRGHKQIIEFSKNVKLRHPTKLKKLNKLVSKNITLNSNADIIPGVGEELRAILIDNRISLKKIGWHKNFSRKGLQDILKKIKIKDTRLEELKRLASSDIFWEKIVNVKAFKPNYDFVYDLTVNDSHNFVVDGVLVHNTAAVVRDEIMRGFALEAGAIVLASGGLCAIDELDKMSDDDTSAMHEALEQQCYHYDFELQFADGSSEKIGDYVEKYFKENKDKVIQGIDCEILDIKTKELLTTDFNKISKIIPKRISRHIAPKNYYKITYSNGRSIAVTPEHPVFVYGTDKIKEISAALIKKGMIVPMPRLTPIEVKTQNLISNSNSKFPKKLDNSFSTFLGFYGAEGHNYINIKNRTREIGFSNTNELLINDIINIIEKKFKIKVNKNHQKSNRRLIATKDLFTGRILKKEFYEFFSVNFPEFMSKAPIKRVPERIKMSSNEIKESFLQGYFLGDGFYDSERCGFSTSSRKMAEDIQDLLLNLEIYSYISTEKRKEKKYYKIVITGEDNLVNFFKLVSKTKILNVNKYGFKKIQKINEFILRSRGKLNSRDTVPYEFLIEFNDFLKKCHVSDGTFTTLIKRKQNSHKFLVEKYLDKAKDKLKKSKDKYLIEKEKELRKFITSQIRWGKVVKVEKIQNKGDKWVYDVTVPPTKTFISQGLVLHNTISIAKANIRATLKCETTVLGAANPKLGRFDPYGDIAKQINFPPALLSRFDLIYILKDIPDKKRDDMIASHILKTHKDVSKSITDLKPDFLKKYIAYAKKIKPLLTDEAIEKIKDFYISIRNSSSDDDSPKPVPITPRQLEALIRLSEAYAKIKLERRVRVEHAQAAIDLLLYCLEKIGIDPKTGELDIDRITTGVTTSTRNQFKSVQMIIDRLETEKPEILFDDICEEAQKQNITRAEVDKILHKLKEEGIIFEPRKNLYKKLL